MQDQAVEKKFCTTREAAVLLGVSVGSVQHWVERGVLEAWKTGGGHRRVLRASVQKLLNEKLHDLQAPPVTVPRPVAAQPAAVKPAPAMRRLRVLVIDDEPELLRLYKATLAGWTLAPEISTSDSAVAGLVLVGRFQPDLLLVDLQMPGMDGLELLRILVNLPETRETRVVVVSGLDAAEVARRGAVPEGIEVLPKPIPFQRLQEIAMEIAAGKQLERRAG